MTDYYTQLHGAFGDGTPWSTGLHITSNQSEAALATTMSNAFDDFWSNATYGVDTLYPNTTATTEVTVATLSGTMKEVSKTLVAVPLNGLTTGDSLPFLNSTLVSLRSTSIQRHGRGRMYLPAMDETFVNSDQLTVAAATRVSTSIKALFSAIRADGSSVFVFNRLPLKDGTPAYQKSIIVNELVSRKPARQSRRVRKQAAVYV